MRLLSIVVVWPRAMRVVPVRSVVWPVVLWPRSPIVVALSSLTTSGVEEGAGITAVALPTALKFKTNLIWAVFTPFPTAIVVARTTLAEPASHDSNNETYYIHSFISFY